MPQVLPTRNSLHDAQGPFHDSAGRGEPYWGSCGHRAKNDAILRNAAENSVSVKGITFPCWKWRRISVFWVQTILVVENRVRYGVELARLRLFQRTYPRPRVIQNMGLGLSIKNGLSDYGNHKDAK